MGLMKPRVIDALKAYVEGSLGHRQAGAKELRQEGVGSAETGARTPEELRSGIVLVMSEPASTKDVLCEIGGSFGAGRPVRVVHWRRLGGESSCLPGGS